MLKAYSYTTKTIVNGIGIVLGNTESSSENGLKMVKPKFFVIGMVECGFV